MANCNNNYIKPNFKYYEHYKTLNIPWNFKTVNGYEYDESGVFLSSWIDTQRKSFKKGELSKERIKLLTKIGMVFDLSEEHWRNMYNLAKKYYKHYGHLNIPGTFKTVNAETINNIDRYDYIVKSIDINGRAMNSGKISRHLVPSRAMLTLMGIACISMSVLALMLMFQ